MKNYINSSNNTFFKHIIGLDTNVSCSNCFFVNLRRIQPLGHSPNNDHPNAFLLWGLPPKMDKVKFYTYIFVALTFKFKLEW